MSDNLETQEAVTTESPVDQTLSGTVPASLVGQEQDWTESVPDKFKSESGVNHEAIYKSYTELEKQFSSRDKAPEDYEFALPDGVELSEEDKAEFDGFKSAFREANLSQDQFNAVMEQMLPSLQREAEALKAEYGDIKSPDAAKAELSEAWGDKYAKNIGAIQSIAKAYNKSGADIDSYGFNDPNVLKLLADLSGQFKEAKPVDGQQVTDSLAQLRANPAYWDTRHPEHAQLQRRVMELTELKVS